MGYDQLKHILDFNREQIQEEKMKSMAEITECPRCGYTKLHENSSGRKACEICGWLES